MEIVVSCTVKHSCAIIIVQKNAKVLGHVLLVISVGYAGYLAR